VIARQGENKGDGHVYISARTTEKRKDLRVFEWV
jgi:hypothetical protein